MTSTLRYYNVYTSKKVVIFLYRLKKIIYSLKIAETIAKTILFAISKKSKFHAYKNRIEGKKTHTLTILHGSY